jgi:hypothetical protein
VAAGAGQHGKIGVEERLILIAPTGQDHQLTRAGRQRIDGLGIQLRLIIEAERLRRAERGGTTGASGLYFPVLSRFRGRLVVAFRVLRQRLEHRSRRAAGFDERDGLARPVFVHVAP